MTRAEMLQALERASAAADAGDESAAADARAIARMIDEMPQPRPTGAPKATPRRTSSSAVTSYAQGLPFIGPLTDEAAAGLWAIPAAIETGQGVGEAYRGLKEQIGANTQRYRAENPAKSLGIELGTSLLAPGGGPANAVVQGATRAGNVARSVGTNVGGGAAAGVAASERGSVEETLGDAAMGGAFGLLGTAIDAPRALRQPTGGTRAATPSPGGAEGALRLPGTSMTVPTGRAARVASAPRGAEPEGFPLTPGEIRARDSGYTDISGMREENAARRGLLGDDAEEGMAAGELARDEFTLNALLDQRPIALDIGEAGEQSQSEVLQTVYQMREAKNAAYRNLGDFEPYTKREDLAGTIRQTRETLLDPPSDTGFRVPLTPESLQGMPYVRSSMEFLDRKLGRVSPTQGNLLDPRGGGNFGLGEIEDARRFLNGQAAQAGQTDLNQARIIRSAVEKLDELTDDLYARGAIRSSRGDPDEFRSALADARNANREYMEVVDGKVSAGRRRVKTQATRLVEDLQAGNVNSTTAIDRIVTRTGRPKAGGDMLLQELDRLAPQSATMVRGALARRLFGNTLDVAEDGSLRIADRRALLNRLEKSLEDSDMFWDDVMGQGWTKKTRRLLEDSKASRVDIGRAGNRFDPMNPSGSGSMNQLYGHLYTGLSALARGMMRTGIMGPAAAGVGAVAEGMKGVAQRAAGTRAVRGMQRAVEQPADVLPEEFVTQWRALRPAAVSGSVSTSGGQAAAADREERPPGLL